jgi:hypothetical protein
MVLSERNSLYDNWVNGISYCLARSDPIKGLSPLNQFIFKIQNINVGIWVTLITQPFYCPHPAEPNSRTFSVGRRYGIRLSSLWKLLRFELRWRAGQGRGVNYAKSSLLGRSGFSLK